MADIPFVIGCKELQIAEIAQINHIFLTFEFNSCIPWRLWWVNPYANDIRQQRFAYEKTTVEPGADLGGGCRGCAPPPPLWDDQRFSNTTGILQKKIYVVYWCWSRAKDECTPSQKKSWIRPCEPFIKQVLALEEWPLCIAVFTLCKSWKCYRIKGFYLSINQESTSCSQ